MNTPIVTVQMDLKAVKALSAVIHGCEATAAPGDTLDRALGILIDARDSILDQPASNDEVLAWKMQQIGEALSEFMLDRRMVKHLDILRADMARLLPSAQEVAP